jgi:Sulfotransferase family
MLNQNPVFVVGVFRSGTSLLCSLLNQNPKIALMYECDVWNFPPSLLGYRFKRNWAERLEFFNHALSRHRLCSKNDRARLDKIHVPTDLYRAFGEIKGASACGEKSPFYGPRLEEIYSRYPNAAFIIVWRNPVEVYRSVVKAGQTSRFFGKPGMLSRMIYHQEQAIRQAARIEKKGARILRVDYADIVDNTEKVCRDISAFLDVPFVARMLELNKADLSAVYKAPHHAYLRRGIIERQKYTQELVSPAIAQKLERYRRRWEQQQAQWLNPPDTANLSKPGMIELAYHNVLGRALTCYDSAIRAVFEFLPQSWLRVYRLLKTWLINPPSDMADAKTSLLKDWQDHWMTILTATAILGVVTFIHIHSNPHLMFLLFYWIPCVLVALVVNTRWATLFVVAATIIAPMIQFDGDSDYRSTGVIVWNIFSRFILLEMMTLTLGRIRREFSRIENEED